MSRGFLGEQSCWTSLCQSSGVPCDAMKSNKAWEKPLTVSSIPGMIKSHIERRTEEMVQGKTRNIEGPRWAFVVTTASILFLTSKQWGRSIERSRSLRRIVWILLTCTFWVKLHLELWVILVYSTIVEKYKCSSHREKRFSLWNLLSLVTDWYWKTYLISIETEPFKIGPYRIWVPVDTPLCPRRLCT